MNKIEIQAILAMPPKEAAAVIKEKFRAKQTFETNRQGDKYFFIVDPTVTIPSTVLEILDEDAAFATAQDEIKDLVSNFGKFVVDNNQWGVVESDLIGPDGSFLNLRVDPGYLERGGRIRRDVDPRVIPGLLVTLMTVKERLNEAIHRLVTQIGTVRWWREMGFLNAERRKQDWSPRED